jgi:hypothetical protein
MVARVSPAHFAYQSLQQKIPFLAAGLRVKNGLWLLENPPALHG